LQQDESDAIEEKIISIVISTIFTTIIGTFLNLFIYTNIFVSITLFCIGLFLSRYINRKIFGVPRSFDELSEYEKNMLNGLKRINQRHSNIRDDINENRRVVYFKDYISLKKEFDTLLTTLILFNQSHLAIKYRTKYTLACNSYKKRVEAFDNTFAHKYRERNRWQIQL